MSALILPMLLGTAGLAMDATNMILSKNQLQDATDAAALAVSTNLASGKVDGTTGQTLGKNFVVGRFANYGDSAAVAAMKAATTVSITTTVSASAGKTFSVAVNSSLGVPMSPLTRMVFSSDVSVAAVSKTTSATGGARALSMNVLLDDSGSMAEVISQKTVCTFYFLGICLGTKTEVLTKTQALKDAAVAMFDAFDKSDPNKKMIRTGAITYANGIRSQSVMDWGTTAPRETINKMTALPSGGTDATTAMTAADKLVRANQYGTDTETVEHKKKVPDVDADRVIVLMSDGEMTGPYALWGSTYDANVRTACTTAKDGGIKIFTVAFMAPEKGKALLKFCASSSDNYYEPETVDTLVAAFAAIAKKAADQTSRLTN